MPLVYAYDSAERCIKIQSLLCRKQNIGYEDRSAEDVQINCSCLFREAFITPRAKGSFLYFFFTLNDATYTNTAAH